MSQRTPTPDEKIRVMDNGEQKEIPVDQMVRELAEILFPVYGDVKPIRPLYCVKTNKEFFHITATTCSIDTDLKIICFYDKGSVQAMFRLDDVNAFNRIV